MAAEMPGPEAAERLNVMKHVGVIPVFSILCTSFMTTVTWSQGTPATLVVEVSNGTAQGTTVVGDPVVLQIFHQQQLQNSLEARVGEDGEAIFEDVPTGRHMRAIARVKHQNMTFQGRPVPLAPASSDYATFVQVFDVSSASSVLAVGTHHIMIAVRKMSFEVTEYMQLQNNSDRAVRGSKRDNEGRSIVIEVMLPEDATDLTPSGFFEPSALVTTETGFYDTLAVPPGEHQIRFSYRIGIDRPVMAIAKEISLPTSELVVFWEGGQGELTGLGEPDERLSNAQGIPVECYRRHDVRAGGQIAFQISGRDLKTSDTDKWITLAVVFALIGTVTLWRLRAGSTPPPVD